MPGGNNGDNEVKIRIFFVIETKKMNNGSKVTSE